MPCKGCAHRWSRATILPWPSERSEKKLAAEQAGNGSVVLLVVVEGTPRALHPIQRDEIYQIVCEALRNAFKHASATQMRSGTSL